MQDENRKQGPDGPPPPIPPGNVSAVRRKTLDIAYGTESPAQKLDVYLPDDGEGPFPVIVNIHGGGFEIGDKRDVFVESWLEATRRGYALVGVNYRLSGEAKFPAAIHDLKLALRFLRAHAGTYKLDPTRFGVGGGSAGGHLSSMLCFTGDGRDFEPASLGWAGQSTAVQAAVDLFGPMDFSLMDKHHAERWARFGGQGPAVSPESKWLGGDLSEGSDLVARANPITHIHADIPPLMIQHGRVDRLVPVGQSILLAEALADCVPSDRFSLEILEGADHADPQFATPKNMAKIFAFFDRWLK